MTTCSYKPITNYHYKVIDLVYYFFSHQRDAREIINLKM
uniref:Uncharacterized protein n=1 Tax=Anguilla anguilla TaxID=7936 RepID=A0A0E9SE55_ANGAN